MQRSAIAALALLCAAGLFAADGDPAPAAPAKPLEEGHPVKKWVKQHPVEGRMKKPSPRMGYETSYGYDLESRLLVRYGGHNQGGGGEQGSDVWTYDLDTDTWTLKEPNDAPPGVCCAQQNVYDQANRKFIRFPAFSGSHGWQNFREINLKNDSVWTYDLESNTWRYMRPSPEAWPGPLHGAAWDPHHQVTVMNGSEGGYDGTTVYDLYNNTWHWMKPDPAPPARVSQPGFAYDEVNRRFAMFGYANYGAYKGTWVYDLRKNVWTKLTTAQEPPDPGQGAILAADTRNGIVLCSVVTGKEPDARHETWVLDIPKSTWTKVETGAEPDASGSRSRVLTYCPDRNLFVLENRIKEQQIWTFRYADAPAPRPAPRNLSCTTEADGAKLAWEDPAGDGMTYNVYRGEGTKSWEVELKKIAEKVKDRAFADSGLKPGTTYFYQVRRIEPDGTESAASYMARTQPPVVLDIVCSVLDAKKVELAWPKPKGDDIVGYHVERADLGLYSTAQVKFRKPIRDVGEMAAGRVRYIGTYKRLTEKPLAEPLFTDETVDLAAGQGELKGERTGGKDLPEKNLVPGGAPYKFAAYAYRVVAVNKLGVESGKSAQIFTYPSAVQKIFAKEEEGGKTRVKWEKHAAKGIKGYLVYRLEGKETDTPVIRLTPEPVDALEYLDENSGNTTRRYEIVAVDALGQEGEPSQPIWSRREWRAFYKPYTTEWHQ